jgi:tetratricopeptide (TPR) repeat protein
LLEQLAPGDPTTLSRTIQKSVEARLIEKIESDPTSHTFVEGVIHEELYKTLAPDIKAEVHERLGDILQRELDDDRTIFEIAHHYLRSGNRRKSAEASLRAAERARASYANNQAATFYRESMAAATDAGLEVDRSGLLEALGDVYTLDGRYADAERAYGEALAACESDPAKARLYGKIGEMYFRRGDNGQAGAHLEQCLRGLGYRLPRSGRGVFASLAWQILILIARSFLPKRLWRIRCAKKRAMARDAVELHHKFA